MHPELSHGSKLRSPNVKTALLLLSLAVWGVFGNTLLNGFVWDDNVLLVGNRAYTDFDLRRIFLSLANGLEYLPIRDLSYAVDYALWGNNPAGFHFTNVLFYWLTVIAVYFLARATALVLVPAGKRDEKRASVTGLVAALLFAVHPIHSEAVSFITCRNALISTLLFLCASCCYLTFLTEPGCRKRSLLYVAAFLCFAASLFAKVTSIVLPFILGCYALATHTRYRRRELLLQLLPFFVASGAAFFFFRNIAVNTHTMIGDSGWGDLGGWLDHLATALQIVGFYIGKLVVPFGYSIEYDFSFERGFTDPIVATSLAGVVIVLLLALRLRKRYPYFLFSVAWFVIALLPVLNFFPTAPVVADRYALLPSFGFIFLVASLLAELAGRMRVNTVAAATTAIAIAWGGITLSCNRDWQSEETLWRHAIQVSPGSINAYTNLGRIYFDADHNDERAFALFAKAQENNPGDPHLDYFLGVQDYRNGDILNAIRHLNKAIGRDIEFMEALYELGTIYEKTGERDKAVAYYQLVLRSKYMDTGVSLRAAAAEHLRALGAPSL